MILLSRQEAEEEEESEEEVEAVEEEMEPMINSDVSRINPSLP